MHTRFYILKYFEAASLGAVYLTADDYEILSGRSHLFLLALWFRPS